ncbi:MAG: DUF5652 family protein [Candidatus Shapirobacteria bacterium]|nr:DUF5652 family protein [Candidatus Shapirobacteria bacterium]MDD4410289.1 DUF5652 family protein [Candidatus Shapirobacteria bacterium]
MNNFLSLLNQPQFYFILLIWTLVWKGAALWKAANKRQLIWFILLLTINTVGIFEIVYIFFLSRWDIDNGKILAFLSKKFKKTKK